MFPSERLILRLWPVHEESRKAGLRKPVLSNQNQSRDLPLQFAILKFDVAEAFWLARRDFAHFSVQAITSETWHRATGKC